MAESESQITKFKIQNSKFKIKGGIFLLAFVLVFFTFSSNTFAKAPSGYGGTYGLLVHQKNQDQAVTRIKALEVLLKFFPDATDSLIDIRDNTKVCDLPFLNCGNRFYAYQPISQKDFLIWFYQLGRLDDGKNSIK
jgi:hypothetical protein